MGIYPEFEPLHLAELIELFEVPSHPDGPIYFSEIAFLIANKGSAGIGYLVGSLSQRSLDHQRAAISSLSSADLSSDGLRDFVVARLRHFLADGRPLAVMEAIDGLRLLSAQESLRDVVSLKSDRSPFVRGAVVRFVAAFDRVTAREIVRVALADSHYIPRESAVDVVDELGLTELVPTLQAMLNDKHPDVRQAAKTAIENLRENSRGDQGAS